MPWPTTYPFFHVDQPEQVDNAALLRRLQRPEGPVDVVLDTDTYNEIDDQYALAYLIKNDEKLKLKAIYAAPFCNNKAATPAIGMQKSYDEIKNILSLMGRTDLLDCTYRGSESYLPDELAIEAPFFGKNVQSMLKLGRAQGVAMAVALSRDIPITEYAPLKIKMAITGNGQASKEQVADMLQRMLHFPKEEMPTFMDATDGLAAAYCHFLQMGRPAMEKGYSSWKDFIAKNPDKVK